MNEITNNKRVIGAMVIFLAIVSGYFAVKLVNEVKQNKYIGAGVTPGSTLVIDGKGEVNAVPDVATETINIREEGKTSKEASDKVAIKEKKALDFLASMNIEKKDIKTTYNSVNPKYEYSSMPCTQYSCPPSKQTIVGYEAMETITVKIRNTDDTGKITQGLSGVGVELSGPNFAIDDEDALKAQAREKAIADAKSKKEILERELGVKLGRIVSFSENSGGYPMYYSRSGMMDAKAESAPAPELPTGENKITSNVSITYEIQ
jgi:uncharacterized protein YggE